MSDIMKDQEKILYKKQENNLEKMIRSKLDITEDLKSFEEIQHEVLVQDEISTRRDSFDSPERSSRVNTPTKDRLGYMMGEFTGTTTKDGELLIATPRNIAKTPAGNKVGITFPQEHADDPCCNLF